MFANLLSSKKSKVIAILACGLVVAGGVGASGAYLSAQEALQVKANVTTLGILVNGVPSNAAPLVIKDIAPGVNGEGHGSFTVGNTSPTLVGTVTIGAPITIQSLTGNANLLANSAAEIKQDLSYYIAGSNGYRSGWQPATDLSTSLTIGDVAANSTVKYDVTVKLADEAGNDWQGASVDALVTMTNTQKH